MSEISDKSSEKFMPEYALDEAASLLRDIAGPRGPDESIKSVLRRLSRRLSHNWSASRVRAVWYRDDRVRVRAEEIEELRSLTAKEQNEAGALAELQSTIERLAKYEPLLERLDAEFFGPEISAARDQIGQARKMVAGFRVPG
jgi:hypothetical protein